MKKTLIAVAFASSLLPLAAQAGPPASLHCTGQEDGTSLSLQQGEAGAATAVAETAQGKSALHGTFHSVTHSVFAIVDEYDLVEAAAADGAPALRWGRRELQPRSKRAGRWVAKK